MSLEEDARRTEHEAHIDSLSGNIQCGLYKHIPVYKDVFDKGVKKPLNNLAFDPRDTCFPTKFIKKEPAKLHYKHSLLKPKNGPLNF